MKKKADKYAKIQYGLSIWVGSAPHLGRAYRDSTANLPVRASEHDKHFEVFLDTDVWNDAGWLITSSSFAGSVVRCEVRKGTQVATLVCPEDTLFFHRNPALPHEDCGWLVKKEESGTDQK